MTLLSWLKKRKTCSVCLVHYTPGVKPGDFHFRHRSQPRNSFNFKCGPSELEVAPSYKYFGVWLGEHLDYQNCVNAHSESARKALGLLIAKSKQFGNFPFEAFSSFYDSLVIPRMDYGAGVWLL